MNIIYRKMCLCECCMTEHEVKTVLVNEQLTFKGIKVDYEAQYQYCDVAEEYYATEEQVSNNDISMKNAYRKTQNLLTTEDIIEIRNIYGISQSDFCLLLGWGLKTITRYEGHQVQDKAHDCILRKLQDDPEWFIELLENSQAELSGTSYERYYNNALIQYSKKQKEYLKRAIEAQYAKYHFDKLYNGNVEFSLNKVISAMEYLKQSKNIKDMSMVKLIKLLWYSDMVAYSRNDEAITGLVYRASTDGADPIGQEFIIDIYESGDNTQNIELNTSEKKVIDYVVDKLGDVNQDKIIKLNRSEQAYIRTKPNDIILYGSQISLNA